MTAARDSNAPYCSNCGYVLTGLTDSSKCPECGKPLVEVLTRERPGFANAGKRYRSKATLFGWPVVDVALGPHGREQRGHAKGVIAIGDIATGGIALGGLARGIVAVGGLAVGLFSMGGLAIGLVSATGGLAVGGFAAGGGGIGVFAAGGGAVGAFAQGGGAVGLFTRDSRGVRPIGADPFKSLAWFFGPWPLTAAALYRPMLITLLQTFGAATLIGIPAWIRVLREPADGMQ